MVTQKKYPQNIHTQFFFLKTPQNIDMQNFEPQKNDLSLRVYENIRVPPPHPSLLGLCLHAFLLHLRDNA